MKTLKQILYASGGFGLALSLQAFNTRVQFHYVDEIGLDIRLVGIVWFFYGLWNALNDPLMGRLSDGTRTRWGRRIPYILFGALPLGIFFFLLWVPPIDFATNFAGSEATLGQNVEQLSQHGPDVWLLLLYFVVILFFFDTLWTLLALAWTALFPEMYPDEKERAAVSGWRQIFTLIGLLLAISALPIIIESIGYTGMGLLIGGLTTASFWLTLVGSQEKNLEGQEEVPGPSLKETILLPIKNINLRWFLVANLAKEYIFLIFVATLPFYAKYVLRLESVPGGLDAAAQEALLLGVPFILAIPFMWGWIKIAQKFGPRKGWIFASLALLPGLVMMFIANDFQSGFIGTLLLVLGIPGLLMMYDLVLAQIIDEDEVVTGQRREGLYFGINGAVIRLAFSAQAIAFAVLLNSSGYNPQLAIQPPAAINAIRLLMAGTPILAIGVVVFALWKLSSMRVS